MKKNKMFEAGELKDGVETFQDKILESNENAELMQDLISHLKP